MVDAVSTNLITQQVNNRGGWVKPNDNTVLASKSDNIAAPEQQKDVASSQASSAIAAYVAPAIKRQMPATSAEYVDQLKKSGKIEGKDYRVEKDAKYTDIVELDAKGNMVKGSAWRNVDGKEKPLGSENLYYREDGKLLYRKSKDAKGNLEFISHHYYNDEISQSTISHDGLTFETKVGDYIKDLQAKGVKYSYKVEKDSTGKGQSHIVEEFDENGKETMMTVWVEIKDDPEKNHVCRDLYNADGKVSVSVVFDKNSSVVVNYVNLDQK